MNTKNIWGTKKILLGGAAILALISTSNLAFAQEEDTVAQTSAVQQVAEENAAEDFVIVTGSRIRRKSIDTIFPINSISQDNITDRGFTNIADSLAEIPAFGGGVTDAGSAQGGSPGQNFVDFLSLGTARTLVLVDGRRFVNSATPSLGGASGLQVDFNNIPAALIERVETIGVGGAAVYGADAIAGTVNVMLKDDYEGLEAATQYTIPEAGGAEVFQAQIVAGGNFGDDNGNVTFSIEYETQEGLTELDRGNIYDPENSYNSTQFFQPPAGSNFNAQRVFYNNQLINLFTNGGVASPTRRFAPSCQTALAQSQSGGCAFFAAIGGLGDFNNSRNFLQFDGNGELVPYIPGVHVPGSSIFFAQGGSGSNLFQETQGIQTPSERIVGTSRFKYDFNASITAKAEFLFANSQATDEVNQGDFQSFAVGGSTQKALVIGINHPLLTAQARNTLIANGVDPNTGTFNLSRFNNDVLDSGNSQETSLWRFSGGFEGSFDLANREFFWDVSFTHGETDLQQNFQITNDTAFFNALDAAIVTQADIDAAGGIANINAISGVTVGLGDVACKSVLALAAGTLTNPTQSGLTNSDFPFVTGCAPLDLFGLNRASPEAKAFVTGPNQTSIDSVSQQFVANLSGSLIDLPAGPVGFNVGYERRLESGAFLPGLANQIDLGRNPASLPNAGSFRTEELYGELSLPLVSQDMNIPLVHELRFEGAYRTINVSTLDNNTEAFTAGGTYSPIEDIQFVGNYTESTRLPSIAQLFSPLSGTFSFASDPCDSRIVVQAANVALRTANCNAVGLDPTTFVSNIVNSSVLGATGGNVNLLPEVSKAFTVGVILKPRFIPNFTTKVDYIDISIDNAITGVTLTQILNACFDSNNFPNDPNCASFTRDATGQIVNFSTGQANAGLFDTQFLQVQGSYFYDVNDAYNFVNGLFGGSSNGRSDWGSISHSYSAFSPLKREFAVGNEDPNLNNTRGGFNDPNVQINFSTTYTKDNWRLFWGVLWQDNPLITTNLNSTDEFFKVFVTDWSQGVPVPGLDANGRLDPANALTHGDGSQFLHNASISYNLEDVIGNSDTTLQLSVSNVFDRTPSRLENARGHFNQSQVLGRTFTFRVRTKF